MQVYLCVSQQDATCRNTSSNKRANHAEAMLLDKKNLNSKRANIGKSGRPPTSYKPLKILTVYDTKHDG